MTKENICTILQELDEFYNDYAPALEQAGMSLEGSRIMRIMDTITDALSCELDPKGLGKYDDHGYDSGSLLYSWLFGCDQFQEVCPTAEALYNYCKSLYKEE